MVSVVYKFMRRVAYLIAAQVRQRRNYLPPPPGSWHPGEVGIPSCTRRVGVFGSWHPLLYSPSWHIGKLASPFVLAELTPLSTPHMRSVSSQSLLLSNSAFHRGARVLENWGKVRVAGFESIKPKENFISWFLGSWMP